MSRALAVLLALGLLLAACSSGPDATDQPPATEPEVDEDDAAEDEPEPDAAPAGTPAPLTGLPTEQDLGERPLLVVKIENTPASRPQSGLDEADVVFEELVEGGVTRFITLFHSHVPELVGPVRSARPVDVELIRGLGERPALAYSGARAEVQAMLELAPIVLLTEGQAGFFRAPERRAPHDLYVRAQEAVAAVTERGATPPSAAVGWRFEEDPPEGAERCPAGAAGCVDPGGSIAVAMSSSYRTDFTYDEGAGVYRREQNGEPSRVTGDGRIGAANVVVLATQHYEGGCCDTAGNPYAETRASGRGRAVILRDGGWYEAYWSKVDADAPLELLASEGGPPFPLKPGPTWVLLPSEERVPAPPGS